MKLPDYIQTKLINNIATDLLSHNATFFIGAGFSRDLGYPSWGELLINIIEKYSLMEKIKDSSLFYLLPEKDSSINKTINEKILENLIGVDFLRLAGYVDLLLKEENNTDIRTEITSIIQSHEIKRDTEKAKFDEYRAVFTNIGDYISEVITTNYDTNLEYCINDHLPIHRNISSLNNSQRSAGKNTIKLYKIHGCIKDNDKGIIITEKDYQEFSSSNKYIFHKIYSTFMENNIVFIGYSLYDPNIRSLLSEVIEEIKQNKEAKKKIYWVTRGEVNPIDKKFYENMYAMQIIDKMEILDFFHSLISLKDSKWNEIQLKDAEWTEFTKELLNPTGLSQLDFNIIISKTIEESKQSEVLNQIYQAFLTNSSPRGTASIAFFTILSKMSKEDAETFDNKITDILLTEDAHLISIIDLIQKDADVKRLFALKEYKRILLESLISRARTNTAFYQYEHNAKALLDYYGAFDGSLGELDEPFIDAFYYNYCYLTNTRTIGYAFYSLNTVQEDLRYFNEETVVKILQQYPNMRKSDVQIEQIEALIVTIPDPEKQHKLRFEFIQKQPIVEAIRYTVYFRLGDILSGNKEFKLHLDSRTFHDEELKGYYESLTGKADITFNENENRFSITYKGEELAIHITPDFKTGETSLFINSKSYNETESIRIRDLITPIIDDTFVKWGLLSKETVQ
ncbi:SIR2 family NAD-dependent protein deacylase [Bacillus thuringiensis]|uniref:SIR2-like domain-containing protein n=1 Tax=Bacillus thuringiensis TaxID=1428 RepID=A0ABD6R581_BACTU|nr:SIR2 family protein [Bacillus thuringiensis]OPD49294.1 hypothetical protein BVF97_19895 [Bacillus thuringiensis]